MNHTKLTLGLAITGACLLSSLALGQSDAGSNNLLQKPNGQLGLIPGYCPLYILMNNVKVLEEIDPSKEQKARWIEIYKKWEISRTEYMKTTDMQHSKLLSELVQKKNEVDPETYNKLEAEVAELEIEIRDKSAETALAIDRQLTKLLNQEQKKRLEQIRLQVEGPMAFGREEIQTALGLTEEQIQAIRLLQSNYKIQTRTAAKLPPRKTDASGSKVSVEKADKKEVAIKAAQSRMGEVRVETMKSIEKVLTNGQRKVYLIKIGEIFDYVGKEKDKDNLEQKLKSGKEEGGSK